MRQPNSKTIIVGLIMLLVCSLILNYLQDQQVNRLMNEIESLEYVQEALSDHIDDLEVTRDSLEYEAM